MDKPKFRYIAMARWKPWQAWPPGMVSRGASLKIGTTEFDLQLIVTAYDEKDQAALAKSYVMWRPGNWAQVPYMVGSMITLEVGESANLHDLVGTARPGELDIVCVASIEQEADWVLPLLKSIIHAASASLSVSLEDVFQQVAPVSTKITGPKRRGVPSPHLHTRGLAKRLVTNGAIRDAMDQALLPYLDGRVSTERAAVLSTTVRRFMRAATQMDSVDRYLDYWLVCEVLTSDIGPDDEAPHSKIAKSLAPHLGRAGKPGKRLVENGLRLPDLFLRRSDIVHGRRDDVSFEDCWLLARIAKELVRKEIGLAYVPDSALEDALSKYEQAKKANKQTRVTKKGGAKG